MDADTGLHYFGARWYDSGIGRFISVDPVSEYENNVFLLNKYIYAYNNPLYYVDPDGKFSIPSHQYWSDIEKINRKVNKITSTIKTISRVKLALERLSKYVSNKIISAKIKIKETKLAQLKVKETMSKSKIATTKAEIAINKLLLSVEKPVAEGLGALSPTEGPFNPTESLLINFSIALEIENTKNIIEMDEEILKEENEKLEIIQEEIRVQKLEIDYLKIERDLFYD